jgi:hypothetical protein
MPGKLYTLRYRKGNIGATTAFIELKDPTGDPVKDQRIAEAIGVEYCNQQVNYKYITVIEGVVADESILPPGVLDKIINPPVRTRDRRSAPANVDNPPHPGRIREQAEVGTADKPADIADVEDELDDDDDEPMNRATPKRRAPEPEPADAPEAEDEPTEEPVDEEASDEAEQEEEPVVAKGKGKKKR